MTKVNDPIPTTPLERTLWVQTQLRLKGKSFSSIAREHDWHRQNVAMAMHLPCYPQEQAIADALGITVKELFPERYDEFGERLHPVRNNSNGTVRVRRIG